MGKSVVLGFSGGIDSQTATRILKDMGYRVVLATINTIGDEAMLCKAQVAAQQLDCEWIAVDRQRLFRSNIIDHFCAEYSQGRTPAPCTRCNPLIKWQTLEEVADTMGIYHIATGHYFNIEQHNGKYYVAKGADLTKDQSYYLWGLKQSTLQRALTPMGSIIKSDVKQNFTDKSESMGICFLRGMHYTEYLKANGIAMIDGNIVNESGAILGQHHGIANYTIGQRRGEGIPEGQRVIAINATTNDIVVGSKEQLYQRKLYIDDINIVDYNEILTATDITVKIRGIGINPNCFVNIEPHGNGLVIHLDDPAYAPAKGQPIVLYRNNLVIGGGIVVDFE